MAFTVSSYPGEAENSAGLDLHAVLDAIRRRIAPIVITMVTVLALTVVTYIMSERQYFATARIGIERQNPEVVSSSADIRTPPLTADSSSVDTEVAKISSPDVLREVVNRLDLDKNERFITDSTPGEEARIVAVNKLAKSLNVARDGSSYAISVSYYSADAKLAADVVNSTLEAYLDHEADQKRIGRDRDIALMKSRLETLKADVERADTAAARFRAQTNLVNVQNDATAAQQSMSVLSQQLANAQAEQAAAEARNSLASARSAGAGSSVVSPVMQQLHTEQARLLAQRAALADRYGERHPALVEVNQQLKATAGQIAAETSRVREGLGADASVARQRTSSIASSMGQQKAQLLQGNAASVKMAELDRETNSAKSLYEALLENYRQAVARQGTEKGNGYIIARATIPQKPSTPNLATFAAGGLISALLAATIVAAGLELTENGFTSRRHIERQLGLPLLASVPDLKTLDRDALRQPNPQNSSAHLIEHPGGLYSESFRSVRTALKLGRAGQTVRSVAISSALPNEGKTTSAFSLARSAAISGLRVLLVDCDLRRQASSRQMGSSPIQYGLIQLLRKECTLEQAITHDSASGCFLLPQKTDDENHYDAIASTAMQNLIASLETQFDLVILDTAPILPIADARAIASMTNATILAVRWRKTPTQAVQLALDQLVLAEANVAGVIMTMVDVRARMAAGDELRYYKSYSHYYS